MKFVSKKTVIVFLIFLVGVFFRFWMIEDVAPSMYWDEVSQGYNSYSILKTGRDEHNELFPIARFKAFGDYKAPVYIYLDVPFIALFGKSTLGVRFPSALFGSLTILLAYLLVYELFYNHKKRQLLALSTSFFLSISPWHIQLSRAAFEANIATFSTVLAVYLFFLAKRNKNFLFIFSAVSFVLAFYSFNAHRVFIPLFVCFLALVYWKDILLSKKYTFIAGVIGFLLLVPFIFYLGTPESKLRFAEVNIFSDIRVVEEANTLTQQDNSLVGKILHNRRILYAQSYVKHYFDFLNPSYLFIKGDENPRFSHQANGQLYLWMLPLLLVGVYAVAKEKKKESLVILVWFFLAPVAAATARETPHALRSETYIPTYEIIAAFGFTSFLLFIRERVKKLYTLMFFILAGIVFYSLYNFAHNYFIHSSHLYSYSWQYGYKEAISEVEKIKNDYDYIVFTNKYGRAYVYVLFYSDIHPSTHWQKSDVTIDPFGFYTVSKVDKYLFREQLVQKEDEDKNVLYVGRREEVPDSYKVLKVVNFLNGDPGFYIAERN